MNGIMEELIALTPKVIAKTTNLLPDNFPAQIGEPILRGVEASARRLADQMAGHS